MICFYTYTSNFIEVIDDSMKQLQDADIHLLRVFAQVAEAGGLSAAQDRLNVALSTISTQIATLEVRLGFKLCERGRSGFQLTAKGGAVLDAARQLFNGLDLFRDEVIEISDSHVGITRIGLLDSIAHNPDLHLSSAINRFKEENRKHQFELHFFNPGEFEAALLKHGIDAAIGWTGYQLPSLRYQSLFLENQVIYCERRHPLFDRPVEPADLEKQDWVRRNYDLPSGLPFSQPPISSATAAHMEGVAHLILSGLYIGFLPEHYARPWVDEGRLRPLLSRSLRYQIDFCLITRKARESNPALSRFTEILLDLH